MEGFDDVDMGEQEALLAEAAGGNGSENDVVEVIDDLEEVEEVQEEEVQEEEGEESEGEESEGEHEEGQEQEVAREEEEEEEEEVPGPVGPVATSSPVRADLPVRAPMSPLFQQIGSNRVSDCTGQSLVLIHESFI